MKTYYIGKFSNGDHWVGTDVRAEPDLVEYREIKDDTKLTLEEKIAFACAKAVEKSIN